MAHRPREETPCPTSQPDRPPGRHRASSTRAPARADPGARRRDGHPDPGPPARRGGVTAASASPTGASDVKGNSDLLNLTQPDDDPRRSTATYLEAGADIVETNTFTAHLDLAGRLRHAGPRLRAQPGRRPAGPRGRATRSPTADRPRFVAGALGPTNRTASISPDVNDPGARNVTFDELVEAYLEQARGLRRRRRRPAAGRDDLRHPQRQGRDLRARDPLRGARPALAGDHLRHDHRRLRPHAVRPGDRGVLELGPARPAARRSASTARSAPPRCGPTSPSCARLADTLRLRSPRTPGCPTPSASTTRRPSRWPRSLGEFAASGLVNLVGGCCGTTPDAHRGDRAPPSTARRPATPAEPQPGAAAVRARAADDHRGQPVRQRRRAHQHHRLGAVPQPDQGRRLRHRARRWRPSRSRTARRSSTSTWTRA